MANICDGNCLSDPNYAVICSFLERYGELLGIPEISYEDLQSWLEDTKDVSSVLTELHICLLRRIGKNSVNFERWERYIVKFCHTFSDVDAWEVERFGYKHSKASTKLKILKNLLECQFDSNSKFKEKINEFPPEALRIQPLGRDKSGLAYWYQLDHDLNLRIYREDQDDVDAETWQLVCRDREELANLIGSLESQIGLKREENDTGDNSNSGSLSSNAKDEPPDRQGVKLQTSSVDSPLAKDESSKELSNGLGQCSGILKIKLECINSEGASHVVKQEAVCTDSKTISESQEPDVKGEQDSLVDKKLTRDIKTEPIAEKTEKDNPNEDLKSDSVNCTDKEGGDICIDPKQVNSTSTFNCSRSVGDKNIDNSENVTNLNDSQNSGRKKQVVNDLSSVTDDKKCDTYSRIQTDSKEKVKCESPCDGDILNTHNKKPKEISDKVGTTVGKLENSDNGISTEITDKSIGNQDCVRKSTLQTDSLTDVHSEKDLQVYKHSGIDSQVEKYSGKESISKHSEKDLQVEKYSRKDLHVEKHSGKDLQVDKHSGKDSQVDKHSGKDSQVEKHSGKDLQVDKHSEKDLQVDEHSGKDSQVEKHSGKDSQVDKHSGKNSQVNKHSGKKLQVDELSDKDLQVDKNSGKVLQVDKHSNKGSQVDKHCNKDSQVDKHSDKDSQVDKHSNKDLQVDKHSDKDSQVDKQSDKDSQVDKHSNKDSQVDKHSDKDSQVDKHSNKYSQVDKHSNKDSQVDKHSGKDTQVDEHSGKDSQVDKHSDKDLQVDEHSGKDSYLQKDKHCQKDENHVTKIIQDNSYVNIKKGHNVLDILDEKKGLEHKKTGDDDIMESSKGQCCNQEIGPNKSSQIINEKETKKITAKKRNKSKTECEEDGEEEGSFKLEEKKENSILSNTKKNHLDVDDNGEKYESKTDYKISNTKIGAKKKRALRNEKASHVLLKKSENVKKTGKDSEFANLNGDVEKGICEEIKDSKVEDEKKTKESLTDSFAGVVEEDGPVTGKKEEVIAKNPEENSVTEVENVGVRRSKRRRAAPVTLDMTLFEKKVVKAVSKEDKEPVCKSKQKEKSEVIEVAPADENSEKIVNGKIETKETNVLRKKSTRSRRKRVIDEQDSSVDSPVEPEVKRSRPARSAALRGRGKRRILELENMSSSDSEDIPLSRLHAKNPPKGRRSRKSKGKANTIAVVPEEETSSSISLQAKKNSRQVKKKRVDSDDDFVPMNVKGRKGRGRGRKRKSSTEEESESDDLELESDSEDGYSPGRINIRSKKPMSPVLLNEQEESNLESLPDDSDDNFSLNRKGRNYHRQEVMSKQKELTEEIHVDDTPCCKCLKYESPEWILLCDKCNAGYHTACLRPPLMIIPDGEWICPPCEHMLLLNKLSDNLKELEVAWKKKERLLKRKERLAFVGISLGNILKQEKKEDDDLQYDYIEEQPEHNPTSHGLARACRARSSVSYQFKEYDELIDSAIGGDAKLEPPPGRSKGKDMSNILDFSDEEYKDRPPPVVSKKRKSRKLTLLDDFTDDEGEEYKASDDAVSEVSRDAEPSDFTDNDSWMPSGARATRKSSRRGGRWSRYDDNFVVESDFDSDVSKPKRKTRTASKKRVNYQELISDTDEGSLEETEESESEISEMASDGSVESRKATSKKEKKKKRRFVFRSDTEDESESEVKKVKKKQESDEGQESGSEESDSDDSGPTRWSRRSTAKQINFKEIPQSDSDESTAEKAKRKKKEQEQEEREKLRAERIAATKKNVSKSDSEETDVSSDESEHAEKKQVKSFESPSETKSGSESDIKISKESDEKLIVKEPDKPAKIEEEIVSSEDKDILKSSDGSLEKKASDSETNKLNEVLNSDIVEKDGNNKNEPHKSDNASDNSKNINEDKSLPPRLPNVIPNRQKIMQEKRQKLREARRQQMLNETKQATIENELRDSSDKINSIATFHPNGQSDNTNYNKPQGIPYSNPPHYPTPNKYTSYRQGDTYYSQPSRHSPMSSSYQSASRGYAGPSGPPTYTPYQGPSSGPQRLCGNPQVQGVYISQGHSQGMQSGQAGFMIDNILKPPKAYTSYLDPDNDDSMSDISDIVNYVTQDEFFKEHIHN